MLSTGKELAASTKLAAIRAMINLSNLTDSSSDASSIVSSESLAKHPRRCNPRNYTS